MSSFMPFSFMPFRYYLDIDLSLPCVTQDTFHIDEKYIGGVIGLNGVNINKIRDDTTCKIKIFSIYNGQRKIMISGKNITLAKEKILACIKDKR